MRYLLKNEKKKELILLSAIYLASQGMLLIISGRWWDDWCHYNQPNWVLWDEASQLGRPSLYLVIKFTKLFPEPGYRIITFVMFYFCMLFLFKILKNWLRLSDEACFWICALYSVIPANDARIVLAVFAYTVGLFFYMAGMSYFSGVIDHERLSWKERIISWILFLLGFGLNSTLCLYAIVLLMILMKKGIKNFFKYSDYVMLPVVYFLIKSHFFPAYGGYADYNSVTFKKLLNAVRLIFPADVEMLKSLINNFVNVGRPVIALVIGLTVFIICERKRFKSLILAFARKEEFRWETDSSVRMKENVSILVVGILVLSTGLFSYVVVRQSGQIATSALGGARCHMCCLWSCDAIVCHCVDGN